MYTIQHYYLVIYYFVLYLRPILVILRLGFIQAEASFKMSHSDFSYVKSLRESIFHILSTATEGSEDDKNLQENILYRSTHFSFIL